MMKKSASKKAMPAKKMMAAKATSAMPMMKKGGKSTYRKGGKSMKGC